MPAPVDTMLRTIVNPGSGEVRKVTLRESTRWTAAGWVLYTGKPIFMGSPTAQQRQWAMLLAPADAVVIKLERVNQVDRVGSFEVAVGYATAKSDIWRYELDTVVKKDGTWVRNVEEPGIIRGSEVQRRERLASATAAREASTQTVSPHLNWANIIEQASRDGAVTARLAALTGTTRNEILGTVRQGYDFAVDSLTKGIRAENRWDEFFGEFSSTRPLAQGAGSELLNALRDGGWNNPDSVAANMMQMIAESSNTNLYQAAISIARKFGGGMQDIGWETFMEEARVTTPEFSGDGVAGGGGLGTGGGGGYGGGGYGGPVYTPPDRRVVEDMVKGQLATKVGRADPDRTQMLTDLFMSEHRRAWDKPELGLDPRASITEKIRAFGDYQRIHKLRPEFMSEDEWVTAQQRTAVNAGMGAKRAEQFAINMAQAGTALSDTSSAVGTSEFTRGNKLDQFKQRLVTSSRSLFEGVQ